MDDSQLEGRDLDAAVAERVMGWRRLTDGEAYPNTFDEIYPHARRAGFDRSRVTDWWFDPNSRNARGDAEGMAPVEEDTEDCKRFAPSTDIAAAMQVVEKMRERRAETKLHYGEWTDGKWYWTATVTFEDQKYFLKNCYSLPLAICRAALAAVKGD